MADPKHTETEAERAARIKGIEAAVEKSKHEKGILPSTPQEIEAAEKLAAEMDANQTKYLKSLMQPKPPQNGKKGR